ncbi:unnamed protein product [Somion occarium]|uniref:Store-operated calcium entry-associated regulatory factor n=1 Tax=Somion occarium TaxID=3059160 RepID=A0ABP1E895_9APHY
MSKIALARIPSLTFYKDAETTSRRGKPIPQLTCIGKPCRSYTPDVVRCVNIGGAGTDVDWKCEADLPEALRFGRVEVSCEGWSGPGDPYVLKGSCGLQYRLVQVPDALRKEGDHRVPSRLSRWYQDVTADPAATIFTIIWTAFLLFIVYSFLKSCFTGRLQGDNTNQRPRSSPGSGWFPGYHRNDQPHDPPPPYSKHTTTSTPTPAQGWQPGFWTGAALGGLGTYLFNNGRQRDTAYDWERERFARTRPIYQPTSSFFPPDLRRSPQHPDDDRGEGPSNLGSIRRSTGLGGSTVR